MHQHERPTLRDPLETMLTLLLLMRQPLVQLPLKAQQTGFHQQARHLMAHGCRRIRANSHSRGATTASQPLHLAFWITAPDQLTLAVISIALRPGDQGMK